MLRPLFRLFGFIFRLRRADNDQRPIIGTKLADAARPLHRSARAGSGVDITARVFADQLSAKWGQPVVVENKPGGDAIIAITAVIGAHDDHVLLFAPASTFTAHPLLHDKLPYDINELAPIARVTNTLIVLVVPTNSAFQVSRNWLRRSKQRQAS